MNVELAIKSMFYANPLNAINAYVMTLGARPQDSALPAYTYEVQNLERADISGQWQAELEVRSIAESVGDALQLHADLMAAVALGTWNGITFTAIMFDGRTIDPPTVGEGDEREPAEVVARFTIIYTE